MIFATDNSHYETVKQLLELNGDPNLKGNKGDVPLHKAAFRDNEEIARLLIEGSGESMRARIDSANDDGNTALHYSA